MSKRKFESFSEDGDPIRKEQATPPPSQKTSKLDNTHESDQPGIPSSDTRQALDKKPKEAPLSPSTSGSFQVEAQPCLPQDSSEQLSSPEQHRKRCREFVRTDNKSRKKARTTWSTDDWLHTEAWPPREGAVESESAASLAPVATPTRSVHSEIDPAEKSKTEREHETKEEDEKEEEEEEEEEEDSNNFVGYWARNKVWPKNFAELLPMSTASNDGKRRRMSDPPDGRGNERARSYSWSRKDGTVPEQYTQKYEAYILTKGLDMDILTGEARVSPESRDFSRGLLKGSRKSITPTVFPAHSLRQVINSSQNRNEALVNRDVTQLLVPPIKALYFGGEEHLEHVCDEVNTFWFQQCVLAGPIMRPDLAIGFFASAFTQVELDKLDSYKSVLNWTQLTGTMFFPFLMCEVKCGAEGLDAADRQNMHSCSVALRAILRLEQEADRYRPQPELQDLSGKILVYSLSHDQKNVRMYGHFAEIQDDKWIYHRYPIGDFNIALSEENLLIVHNSVRNVLDKYAALLMKRLKGAMELLPAPSGLSFSVHEVSLKAGAAAETAAGVAAVLADEAPSSQEWAARSTSDLRTSERAALKEQTKALQQVIEQLSQEKRDQTHSFERQLEQQREMFERQLDQQKELIELLKQAQQRP